MDDSAHVPMPDLIFRDGTPVSGRFDDVYFSRAGGVEETTHVFLHGNGLPGRWMPSSPSPIGGGLGWGPSLAQPIPPECPPPNLPLTGGGTSSFTILELGFGTGLNFLVTLDSFLRHAPAHLHLHYIAVEQFPLTAALLAETLALYPQFQPLTAALITAYPLRLPGIHRIHLPRVTLTLGFGEASELLPQLKTHVDAIYLDGFSPAKNTGMWTDDIFAQLARLSHNGTTLATFTSAGFVRRGLTAQGFTLQKIPGYGHKREMSVGHYTGTPTQHASSKNPHQHAVLIGGGLAGCTLAHALATRGIHVTLLERNHIASGASGNDAGVLFPQLTKRWTPSAAWYFAGYSFMLHQLARWQEMGLKFPTAQPGMLRLPRHDAEAEQLRSMHETLGLDPAITHWINPEEASTLAGVKLATGAAHFPHGTWVSPAALCAALVTHPNITLRTEWEAASLQKTGEEWHITNTQGETLTATHLAITNARDAATLLPDIPLALASVGGQISEIAAANVAAPLRSILCHKGYVIPLGDRYLTGATYNHGDASTEVTPENHEKNLTELQQFLPNWHNGTATNGRTSLRTTTPDRLPYAGLLEPTLAISSGHGSRGLLSTPLAAELIAAQWCSETPPVTAALAAAVHPLRRKK